MKNQFFLLFVSLLYFTPLNAQVTLRDTTNQYDYIIITVPEFVNACQDFKTHKETVRNFQTIIVDTTQIYAEFDSAATREDNIRNFISYAGTFWREPRPKFFLIVGNIDAVPNFEIYDPFRTTYSDFYYTQSVNEPDSLTYDFYVGRIPASNSIEIENYFNKVISYETNNTLYDWMNNNLFICEYESLYGFLNAAIYMSENYLPNFIRSFFITDYDTLGYYGNKDSIYKAINDKGVSMVWFEGVHRDSSFYSQDFNLNDVNGFHNQSKYFLTTFIATQSSIIDSNTNLTKDMLTLPDAGSLGGIIFTGTSWWNAGRYLHYNLAQRLYDPDIHSLAEAVDIYPPQGFENQKRITNLWADPSLQLKYDMTVGIDESKSTSIINEFSLKQNYPNPFNPTTTIKYQVPVSGNVSIKIYNILGKEVAELVNENKNPGSYEAVFDAAEFPSGVYFYRIQAKNFVQTKKMVLLK